MAAERFVLCRRTLNDHGAPVAYCARPITVANALDWCEGCRARLPLWPGADPLPAAA